MRASTQANRKHEDEYRALLAEDDKKLSLHLRVTRVPGVPERVNGLTIVASLSKLATRCGDMTFTLEKISLPSLMPCGHGPSEEDLLSRMRQVHFHGGEDCGKLLSSREHLIPQSWEESILLFPGTARRHPAGNLYIFVLDHLEGRWREAFWPVFRTWEENVAIPFTSSFSHL